MTSGWGEGEDLSEGAGEIIPSGDISLGNGHYMRLHPDEWKKLLHHPIVVAAVTARTEAILDAANALVQATPENRRGKDMPAYKMLIQNRTDTTRARGRVYPRNMLGAIDNATYQTLLKAMDMYPSDAIGEGIDTSQESEIIDSVESDVEDFDHKYDDAQPGDMDYIDMVMSQSEDDEEE